MTRAESVFVLNEIIGILNEKATREQVQQSDLDFRRFVRLSVKASFDELLDGDVQIIEDYLCKHALACEYPKCELTQITATLNFKEVALLMDITEKELSDLQLKLAVMSDVLRREGDLRADYIDLANGALVELLCTIDAPLGENL